MKIMISRILTTVTKVWPFKTHGSIHRLGNLSSVMQPSEVLYCGLGGWRWVRLGNPSITVSLVK